MRTISITEALNELKLYDSKIEKAINNAKFVAATKKSSDKVGVMTREDFEKRAKASYQSIRDLIQNRNKLKSAIVKSNAVTEITVGSKTMTRAEGIERKNSVAYDESFLFEMKQQYSSIIASVDKENRKVDAKVDELIATLVGKDSDKKLTKEDQEAIEKPYRDKNEYEFVDPCGLYDAIRKLEAEIDEFKSNIDTALVISNATTTIELDF